MNSIITKEIAVAAQTKLTELATRIGKGFEVTSDIEVEPKEGYFGVTVYFENTEYVAALNKAKNALLKNAKAGVIAPAKAPKVAAAKAPTTLAITEKTAIAISKVILQYKVSVSPAQITAAFAGTALPSTIKKLSGMIDSELFAKIESKKILWIVAVLCSLEYKSSNASVSKLMTEALTKVPELVAEYDGDGDDSDDEDGDDEDGDDEDGDDEDGDDDSDDDSDDEDGDDSDDEEGDDDSDDEEEDVTPKAKAPKAKAKAKVEEEEDDDWEDHVPVKQVAAKAKRK